MKIVEPVQEQRVGAPARWSLSQCVKRAPRKQLRVDAVKTPELVGVAEIQRGHVTGVPGAPGILAAPAAHRAREAIGAHERAFELGYELAGRRRKASRLGRPRERPERC